MEDLTNSSEPVGETETMAPMSETTEPSSPSPGAETPVTETPEEVAASNPDEDSSFSPKPSEMPLEKQDQEEQDKEDAEEAIDDVGKESEEVVPLEAEAEADSAEVPESSATDIATPVISVADVSAAPTVDISAPTAAINGDQVVEANGEAEIKEKAGNEKPVENKEEDSMPPEEDDVVVQPHWLPKPCVHVTSIGGSITEEELSSLFSEFGKVASIVFENEKKDAAIIRYETALTEGEELVVKVKEKLHNTQMGDRTLLIEAFRSDSLLFIGNLTSDIDDELLRKMFEQQGTVERAFVLRNAAGRSKRYGFVEYSLKSQALAAKTAMGNINMDGRVLRVEWSDCKKVADMFSTVLFVDRIPKDPNVDASLRALFGQYGKVRDCHLAIGMHNQYRGFAFIDFYHSLSADKAHQALDGHVLDGHNIRVSFANPSKSAQAYKSRFGSQSAPGPYGPGGRGAFPGMMGNAPVRGHMPMAMPGQRYMGAGRSGIMGMGMGMQFGRGSHVGQGLVDQGHPGSGAGMLGAGATPAGMMGRPPLVNSVPPRRGMAVGGTLAPIPRMPVQGHSSINPTTIAQVATAQAKVREAKARSEEYYQHQPQQTVDNTFKPADSQYGYQQHNQQPNQQQQTSLQTQFQQQVGQHTQQPYAQYYQQAAQGYVQSQPHQQPQQGQSAPYYQQQPSQQEQAIQPQPYAYAQPYAQQYSQQYGASSQQQYNQQYSQPGAQMNTQQYQQTAQLQVPSQYGQSYNQPAAQSSAQQYQQMNAAPLSANPVSNTPVQPQDGTQQQSYASYYNQQQQQNFTPIASSAAQTSNVVGTSQQSLEAQWAAYYASQAAYQQQVALASYPQQQQQQQPPATTTYNEPEVAASVGQKRSHDQMDAGSQSQMAYNYQQQMPTSYPQQVPTAAVAYQQNQAISAIGYQQNSAISHSGYQQQTNAQAYPNQTTVTGYQQPIQATTAVPVADGYQQQPVAAAPAAFQSTPQGQAVNAAVYDYNKRPRF